MEHKRIGEINGIDYETYIRSEAWHMKRMMVARLANFRCHRCGKEVYRGFHIHHLSYRHFGDEPLCDLMFLCEDCHKIVHGVKSKPKNRTKELDGVVCKQCGCKNFTVKRHKNNVGAYCCNCGKWVKFLNKNERKKLGF